MVSDENSDILIFDRNDKETSLQILPEELAHLDGTEKITPGTTVRDFWAWALGDLRLNSTRGLLAQFLVARAVGDARRYDDGWGAFDVQSELGAKIEVKTSAYLQSWSQKRHSSISFSGLLSHRWSEIDGYSNNQTVMADIYVFCVQTCRNPADYNPLDLSQWDFYIVTGSEILRRNQKSMRLSTVQQLAGDPVEWSMLGDAVNAAYIALSEMRV